jgi:hypothetical protein
MANSVLLNNIDHIDLKVVQRHGAEFGDCVNQALVFPTEFSEVQREYPILFRKDEDGKFQTVALLGFDKGENLLLRNGHWQARHVPVLHQRGPFMIGFQSREADGETRREPVIYVDLDDPRVGQADGYPLFLSQGGNAPYLEHVTHVLRAISLGMEAERQMFDAFEAAGLIEPASLDIRIDEHTVYQVPDIYSISEQKLAALDGETLAQLHQSGFLRLAYFVLSSLSNVNRLIELKNEKRRTELQAQTG